MADHWIHEFSNTIRHNPVRASLAAVLLITTTFYVCAGHPDYRVAEMGDATSSADVVDLTADQDWSEGFEQVAVDENDAPATTTRVGGRERYIDAQLTHAVAVEDEFDEETRRRVEQVSGEAERRTTDQAPVWLLGVLSDD